MNISNFIDWLIARLIIKHKEDDIVIQKLKLLKNIFGTILKEAESKIDNDTIEHLCKKCWHDFDQEKLFEEDFGGYTQKEKEGMRGLVTVVMKEYVDIINQKVCERYL